MVKKKRRITAVALLFINLIMLVAAVVPHHHHTDGTICIKADTPAEHQCPVHHHPCHHQENDPCCNDGCITHFESSVPTFQTDSRPDYVFITTLFTDAIIEELLRPQEKRIKNYYTYLDTLPDADYYRIFPLRAPPVA